MHRQKYLSMHPPASHRLESHVMHGCLSTILVSNISTVKATPVFLCTAATRVWTGPAHEGRTTMVLVPLLRVVTPKNTPRSTQSRCASRLKAGLESCVGQGSNSVFMHECSCHVQTMRRRLSWVLRVPIRVRVFASYCCLLHRRTGLKSDSGCVLLLNVSP
jgi:hypothetical protein